MKHMEQIVKFVLTIFVISSFTVKKKTAVKKWPYSDSNIHFSSLQQYNPVKTINSGSYLLFSRN